jgi:hypothetical protein
VCLADPSDDPILALVGDIDTRGLDASLSWSWVMRSHV